MLIPSTAIKSIPRSRIDTAAWDACVSAAYGSVLYGYSWYLDAVLAGPNWKWVGLVLVDQQGGYRAVMPVPLRKKWGRWVVHQPFFCQFLDVFSPDETVDVAPFLDAVQQHYRYGSVLSLHRQPDCLAQFQAVLPQTTHVLDLSPGYEAVFRRYTADRKLNLRRALRYDWTVTESTDPEPLITLFRNYHADEIDGGVGAWAYDILRRLISVLQARGLASIRYALAGNRVEAGALFVQEGNRIVYLFNAASETGRRGNARTLLIDQVIRVNAGRSHAGKPTLFDFESPQKKTIVDFYRSFGTTEDAFTLVRWNRLTLAERLLRKALSPLRQHP
jgi:hypothetical protein